MSTRRAQPLNCLQSWPLQVRSPRGARRAGALALSAMLALGSLSAAHAQSYLEDETTRTRSTNQQRESTTETDDARSTTRLRQNGNRLDERSTLTDKERLNEESLLRRRKTPYVASEFERYVQKALGQDKKIESRDAIGEEQLPPPTIKRFGAELLLPTVEDLRKEPSTNAGTTVPPDYVLGVGDEVMVNAWGAVDADLRLVVDRSGRISIPRVGPILVAGVRFADLNNVLRQRIGTVFKNFQVSASLGRLRAVRVYVTGFAQRPGAHTVSGLSTLVNALIEAGGPSASGSFRRIELRRGGELVTTLDFYKLLIKGDKTSDRLLQAEDVIYVGPSGPQVAIVGSVNKPAIFEMSPSENLEDVLNMAGGFNAVADTSRVAVQRIDFTKEDQVVELQLPAQASARLKNGDIVRTFSLVSLAHPRDARSKRVRVEGEVLHPGEYVLPAKSTLADAIAKAGGVTQQAYIFGTEFTRDSVRASQQENYDRALRDLETEFTRNTSTQRALSADEAAAQTARASGATRLIERLRAVRPNGRIVLQLAPNAAALPNLMVEDGDRISIPAKPNTVAVFGSVFNGGSYLYTEGSSIEDALRQAGGPTRGADTNSVFVLRANGSVVSTRQSNSGWLSLGQSFSGIAALPGDTVFVPEELNKTTFAQEAKEWTQILYQFGLGVAALKTLQN